MASSFVDHFGAVAQRYADFRPGYPSALFEWLAAIADSHDLAWDCATGTGQAARDLAAHFARVIATDASAGQIERAIAHPRVEYRVARAEASGLGSGSADLLVVAQALHWFDSEGFFAEAERVLKPGGVLAVWTYGALDVGDSQVDAVVKHYDRDIVGPYWPEERALVDTGYRAIALPFAEIEPPAFEMSATWPLKRLLGYMRTWSATSAYAQALGSDPLGLIEGSLAAAWGLPQSERRIVWPLSIRVGRKPRAA